jgi:NAD-dependent DNA ligase
MYVNITDINNKSHENFIKYINNISLTELKKLKDHLDNVYYNIGDTGLEDYKYDIIKETIEKKDPRYISGVGADVGVNETIKLPFYLGSMQKIKPEDTGKLDRWLVKNNSTEYMISGKLDGVSCLAVYEKDKNVKLYTRGNGKIGKDISWLSKYNTSLPNKMNRNINIRGELIVKDSVFDKKYKNEYSNARAMVTGILGSKVLQKGAKDIQFVAYEVLDKNIAPKPSEQFELLNNSGIEVVQHEIIKMPITVEILTENLLEYKNTSSYYLDGLIVQSNVPVKRKPVKYPEYAFAFKIDGESINVLVEKVVWDISKWGAFKPVVHIKPTYLGGVTIRKATAHNAKYIYDNNIGPGAKITIIRSGDVIPKIIKVINQSSKPQMPDYKYKWNETHVDIYIQEITPEMSRIMCIKRIHTFFQKLEVKEIGPSRVKKMYDNGLKSIISILIASQDNIINSVGSKPIGVKIYSNIRSVLINPDISLFVGASGVFGEGIGQERVTAIAEGIPDIFEVSNKLSKPELSKKILNIEGFSDITTKLIVDNIYWASLFVLIINKLSTKSINKIEKPKIIGDKLKNQVFVVTGFTDKILASKIEALGGTYTTKWSTKVTGVIASEKSLENRTGKIKKAFDKGIPVYSLQDFENQFL